MSADPRLNVEAASRGLIPTQKQLEIDQSAIPGLAGMALPFEIVYMIGYILSMNVTAALITFVALMATVMLGWIYPAQKRVAEKDKPGTFVRETVQFGPHIWPEQNRYIAVIPAVKPIEEIDFSSILNIIEERDLILKNMGGDVIISGLPIDMDIIRKSREKVAEETDRADTTKKGMALRILTEIHRYGKRAWPYLVQIKEMAIAKKRFLLAGLILGLVAWFTSPLWMNAVLTLARMIGWNV